MARLRPPHRAPLRPSRGAGLVALLLATLLFAGCVSDGAPEKGRTMVDATGTVVEVSGLDRILPTSVDLVEILLALGHGDRIVAVPGWIESSSGCIEVPAGAEDLPRIGRPHVINPEEVLQYDPGLVLEKPFPLSPTPLAGQLRRADIDVFVFDHAETLDNLEETYRLVGKILEPVDPDAPANAAAAWAALAGAIEETTDTVAEYRQSHGHPALRAVFQFPAGLVGAKGTSSALLLELAGAHDIASAAGLTGYRQLSSETLTDGDPERVVATCTSANSPGILLGAPKYSTTTAARLGPETVRIVDPSHAGLVGPRFPRAVADVASWLYPEAFGLITADVATSTVATDDGVRLEVSATDVAARDGPVTYRFLAGDGSDVITPEGPTWSHDYIEPGTHTARILIVDAEARVLEHRVTVEVP